MSSSSLYYFKMICSHFRYLRDFIDLVSDSHETTENTSLLLFPFAYVLQSYFALNAFSIHATSGCCLHSEKIERNDRNNGKWKGRRMNIVKMRFNVFTRTICVDAKH